MSEKAITDFFQDAWVAFHGNKDFASKYLKSLYIGDVADYKPTPVQQDFRLLRQTVEDNGWLRPDPVFFITHFLSLLFFDAMAVWILWQFGTGWLPWVAAIVLFATAQAQAGWTQHDYGHQSVFRSSKINHLFHHLTVGVLKGASSHWWNFRHSQHHAKPNKLRKDPDVEMAYVFLLGKELPREWGAKQRGIMPYSYQHFYFFLLGPPLLLPLYFHYEIIYFCMKRRDYLDLFLAITYLIRIGYTYTPFLSGWGTIIFYFLARVLESHWFVWITQMNHIPNDICYDQKDEDWFTMQLRATSNVNSSPFFDWFSGHLNYQIEHHLFPTMPRHNYAKVAPLVKSLCEKHGIEYRSKTWYKAFADIVWSLRASGQIWYKAYYE
ncbi:hypothetical protein C0Q70_04375 [Pomacea canaliculata]|uniref:Fatty acid desaturase domain-containing protein n=1 Tax=Pomacea canaliculata TaxID=400727 RepID=A0A2T7PVB9_POMCA|nr:hypothetical protein C0Q70_04375 [Pomacea canaliculata]